jgi:hypothetical protein
MFRGAEKRTLRGIFISLTKNITVGWRKLKTEELHNLKSSSSIIMVIKKRMRLVGHTAST